ncbi:MAG TPA: VOC family protein [Thermoanaerobaculia bacterium]|jgi:glyoxylase I family protein
MRVRKLDHYNITGPAAAIEACRRFYSEVLGLTVGHRPPFRSTGFWLYADGHPIVHLTIASKERPATATDHIAFACDDYESAVDTLRRHGVAFEADDVPLTGQRQLFLTDPAGVHLELNFRG